MAKCIEYTVYRGEDMETADVDTVHKREADKLIAKPDRDILCIFRTTRWGDNDRCEVDREEEVLYQRK